MHRLCPGTRRSIWDWAEAHLSAGRSFYGLERIASFSSSFSSSPLPGGPQGEGDSRAGAGRGERRVSGEGGEGEGRQGERDAVGGVGGVEEEEEEEEDLAPPAKRPRSDPRSDPVLHMVAHGGGSGDGSGGGGGGKSKRGEVEMSSAVYALITCQRHTPGAKCIASPSLELRRVSPFLSFRLVLSGRHLSTHRQCDGCWHACNDALRDRGKRDHMRVRHDRRLSGRPAPPLPRRDRAF
jgi:hypothetical protein